jgi:hypothetical protein
VNPIATALRAQADALVAIADAIDHGAAAPELPPLLSPPDAARAANVSHRIIREAIRSGALEASGTSRTRVIERAALLAWIASRKVRVRSADDVLMARAAEITRANGVEVEVRR